MGSMVKQCPGFITPIALFSENNEISHFNFLPAQVQVIITVLKTMHQAMEVLILFSF